MRILRAMRRWLGAHGPHASMKSLLEILRGIPFLVCTVGPIYIVIYPFCQHGSH